MSEDLPLLLSTANGNLIAVADIDAGSNTVQMTLQAAGGTLSLSTTSGLIFSTGEGASDATLVFTGTLASINAALNGLTFVPSADYSGAATIRVQVDDQGNSGLGGSLTSAGVIDIAIAPVNDAPVISMPSAQSAAYQATRIFDAASNNVISISDVDAGSGTLELTLTASHGKISLGSLAGLSFTAGDGSDDVSMTMRAALADLNAALLGLTFTPAAGFIGTAQLAATADDLGNTGAGGGKSDTQSVNIAVAVGVAPVVITDPTTLVYLENDGAVIVDSSLTVADTDSSMLAGAAVQIVNFVAGQDALDFVDQNGIAGNFDASTGTLTMTGTASVADYQAALRSVAYRNSSFNPSDAARVIRFTANDGTLDSAAADRALAVTSVNNAPTSTGVADVFVHEEAAPTSVDVASAVSDLDDPSSALTFALISNSNPALFSAVHLDAASGQMVFEYARDANGAASFVMRVSDPYGASVDIPFAVHVSTVNDAPVLTINAGLQAEPNSKPVISSDLLRVTDVDNAAAQLICTLTTVPAHGTLLLDGVALAAGDSFSQADVDSGALAFQATAGADASNDSFSFRVSDGAGGTLSPITFAIQIAAEPVDPPSPPPPPPPAPPPSVISPPTIAPPVVPEPAPVDPSSVDMTSTETTPSDDTTPPPVTVPPGSTGGSTGGPSGGASAEPAPPPAAPAVVPAPAPLPPAPEPLKLELPKIEAPAPAEPALAPQPIAPAPVAEQRGGEVAIAQARAAFSLQSTAAAKQVAFVAAPETALVHDLDALKETVTAETRSITAVAGSAGVVSAGISMIYLLWTIRGGYLLASLLSSMPAWRLIDPLPILDRFDDEDERRRKRRDGETDDESLESLAEGGNAELSHAARSIP